MERTRWSARSRQGTTPPKPDSGESACRRSTNSGGSRMRTPVLIRPRTTRRRSIIRLRLPIRSVSHLSRMPQACVGQARGTGLRPRSLRIDRYRRSRCTAGLNWEYQPHLATYATMCLTEVEREFSPASADSRWDPLTRYLKLIVPGVSVTWWRVTLSEQPQDVNEPAASRISGYLVTCATCSGHCESHHLILTVIA